MVSRSGFGIWCHDPGIYLFFISFAFPVLPLTILLQCPSIVSSYLALVCFWFLLFFINLYFVFVCTLFSFCYFGFCLFDLFLFFLVPLVVWFCFYLAFVNKAHLLFPFFLPPMSVCFWVLIKLPTP